MIAIYFTHVTSCGLKIAIHFCRWLPTGSDSGLSPSLLKLLSISTCFERRSKSFSVGVVPAFGKRWRYWARNLFPEVLTSKKDIASFFWQLPHSGSSGALITIELLFCFSVHYYTTMIILAALPVQIFNCFNLTSFKPASFGEVVNRLSD